MPEIAFVTVLVLIIAASVPCWRTMFERRRKGEPLVGARLRVPSPIGLIDLGIAIFLWLVLQVLAGGLAALITGSDLSDLNQLSGNHFSTLMLCMGVSQLLSMALVALLLLGRYRDVRILGWYQGFVRTDVKYALVAFLIVAPIMFAVQTALSNLVEYEHPALEAMLENGNALTMLTVWLTAGLLAPITEEFFFRGLLQSWLQRLGGVGSEDPTASLIGGWAAEDGEIVQADLVVPMEQTGGQETNPYVAPQSTNAQPRPTVPSHGTLVYGDSLSNIWNACAILITSAFFAAAHWGQGLAPIPLFGFSIVLGYLYQRTGSLLPSIGLHMLLNGFSLFWLTVQILFPEADVLSNALLSE